MRPASPSRRHQIALLLSCQSPRSMFLGEPARRSHPRSRSRVKLTATWRNANSLLKIPGSRSRFSAARRPAFLKDPILCMPDAQTSRLGRRFQRHGAGPMHPAGHRALGGDRATRSSATFLPGKVTDMEPASRFDPQRLIDFATAVYTGEGVPAEDARLVADTL